MSSGVDLVRIDRGLGPRVREDVFVSSEHDRSEARFESERKELEEGSAASSRHLQNAHLQSAVAGGFATLVRMRLWGGLVAVVVILAACRGGGDDSFTSSTGGSGPVVGSGSSGATGMGDGPVPVDAEVPVVPFVACSLPDAAGGADADVADADVDDAGSPPLSEDGGAGDSPCATPPPSECNSKTMMVVWNPGPCDGVQCVFEATFEPCPGGCFRQMDGGTGCNP
ncbi:MAG: hypothetical protein BGO98_16495 [Myxococcales bacterium 68-20]|nr:MAG: hypothetical protein BGO98_16495 [Myxococcales bacterium 68-20]